MLPLKYRLKRMKDFAILTAEGRFVPGALHTLKFWRIDPAKYPRRAYAADDLKIGFVVSTKVSKKAVERNRVKRQMREVVRLLLQANALRPGYLVAVVAKTSMIGKEYHEIATDIHATLLRSGLLQKKSSA